MSNIVSLKSSGDFKKTIKFLEFIRNRKIESILDEYGQRGVDVLSKATPVRTGETAGSWYYVKEVTSGRISLEWRNSKKGSDGKTPVVILIINGHGTRTGGYVPPNDFVTPIMEEIFNEAAEAVWKVVTNA